jgi:hypothetical protein
MQYEAFQFVYHSFTIGYAGIAIHRYGCLHDLLDHDGTDGDLRRLELRRHRGQHGGDFSAQMFADADGAGENIIVGLGQDRECRMGRAELHKGPGQPARKQR